MALLPIALLTWRMIVGDSPTRAVLYADAAILLFGFLRALQKGRSQGLSRAAVNFGRTIFKKRV